MRLSINKDIFKKLAFIGINYQLIAQIPPILFFVMGSTILGEELDFDIKRHTAYAILWAITIPPIWEELFFRKFLYTKLKQKLSINRAMIISSIVFGLMHINLYMIIFAYGVGIISCKVYEKTGDIKYSILLHSIMNGFTSVFNNYVKFNIVNNNFNLYLVQIVLTVVLLLAIVIYRKYSLKLIEYINVSQYKNKAHFKYSDVKYNEK